MPVADGRRVDRLARRDLEGPPWLGAVIEVELIRAAIDHDHRADVARRHRRRDGADDWAPELPAARDRQQRLDALRRLHAVEREASLARLDRRPQSLQAHGRVDRFDREPLVERPHVPLDPVGVDLDPQR